jgi:hypothetical protein
VIAKPSIGNTSPELPKVEHKIRTVKPNHGAVEQKAEIIQDATSPGM